MNVLILGHKGMLGHMVVKYFNHKNINVLTTDYKWDSNKFKDFVENLNCDYIVNCIGSIPQKKSSWKTYKNLNILLPLFLSTHKSAKIIHPTTDAEFDGLIEENQFYSKNSVVTAVDDYGLSKSYISLILKSKSNVKQIRTSIIGPELNNKVSLMEWFFKQTSVVNGYVNHYWNGITTLEWAKQCYSIINNWNNYPDMVQIGTNKINKYELLCLINKIFKNNKNIISISVNARNRCLYSDYVVKSISDQLNELKNFYYKNISIEF